MRASGKGVAFGHDDIDAGFGIFDNESSGVENSSVHFFAPLESDRGSSVATQAGTTTSLDEGASGGSVAAPVAEALVLTAGTWKLGSGYTDLTLTGSADVSGIGNALNNVIIANGGNNTLSGNAGDDILYGGAGDDILKGGIGNDIIIGGAGRDIMIGGAGSDIFVVRSASESGVSSARDIIRDFTSGQDRIDLSGVANFTWLGGAAFHHNGSAELRFILSASGAIVAGDVDGDGRADFQVQLKAVSSLSADDFILNSPENTAAALNATLDAADTIVLPAGIAASDPSTRLVITAADHRLGQGLTDLILTGIGDAAGVGNDLNNTITGNDGNNKLAGNAGNDVLDGAAGNDTINGGDGDDIIIGGAGRDLMTGGAGADRFVFRAASDSGIGSARDRISDFHSGEDHIDLSAIADFNWIGTAAFHHNGVPELRYTVSAVLIPPFALSAVL